MSNRASNTLKRRGRKKGKKENEERRGRKKGKKEGGLLLILTLTDPELLLDSATFPAFCLRCKHAVNAQPNA